MEPPPPQREPHDELDAAYDPSSGLAVRLHRGEDVLGDWYEAEYPRVHRLCQGFLASRSAADDAAQDAMLHLAQKLEQWDPARPYGPWRNRVVLHLCRDLERASARRALHESESDLAPSSAPDPLDAASTNEVSTWIDRALALLAPREREVFVLVDLEGGSASEVADQLGIAASTVRATLAFARRRLREALAPSLGVGVRE